MASQAAPLHGPVLAARGWLGLLGARRRVGTGPEERACQVRRQAEASAGGERVCGRLLE
jgi:hypothetical protein